MKTRLYAAPAVKGLKGRICHFVKCQIQPFNTVEQDKCYSKCEYNYVGVQ